MSTSIPSSASPIDIKALLAEFDASGQSAAAFARSKGVAPWKMYNALQRRSGKLRARRRRSSPEKPALLPVRLIDANGGTPPGPLELILAGGHRILIGPDFDALTLRRVLEALAAC